MALPSLVSCFMMSERSFMVKPNRMYRMGRIGIFTPILAFPLRGKG